MAKKPPASHQPVDPFLVGVRLADWAQGFSSRIYGGILDFIRAGHPLELHFEQPSGAELPPVHVDETWQGDGVLVFRYDSAEARAWQKRKVAVVNLSTEELVKGVHFPRVTMDNHRCGEMAAEHMLRLGLRHFAYWHDPQRLYSRERLEGYRRTLAAAGYDVFVLEIPSSTYGLKSRARLIEEVALRAIARLPKPCGLFAKDDIAAVCAIRVLRKAGLRVPDDVPVMGVADDSVYCHATNPPISSVRFPGRSIGRNAAELIHRMMSGEKIDATTRIVVPPRGLIVRESTGHVELPDPVVTKALSIIRLEGSFGRLSAVELSRMVGVSREALRAHFQQVLGRSPKQELDRVRADHCAKMLREHPNWTLDRIAQECGFQGNDEFCRFFKRVKGVTAGEWRLK